MSSLSAVEAYSSSHATEKAFRRYEHDIARVVAAWPSSLRFKVLSMTPVSYMTSFRLACRMLIHPTFPFQTDLNPRQVELLFQSGLTIRCFPATQEVLIGPKLDIFENSARSTMADAARWSACNNKDVFAAFVLLKHYEQFVGDLIIEEVSFDMVAAKADEFPNLNFALIGDSVTIT
jgi:hypothetical protein